MSQKMYKVRTRLTNGDLAVFGVKAYKYGGRWIATRDGWGKTPAHKRFNNPEAAVADLAKRAGNPVLAVEPLQSAK